MMDCANTVCAAGPAINSMRWRLGPGFDSPSVWDLQCRAGFRKSESAPVLLCVKPTFVPFAVPSSPDPEPKLMSETALSNDDAAMAVMDRDADATIGRLAARDLFTEEHSRALAVG